MKTFRCSYCENSDFTAAAEPTDPLTEREESSHCVCFTHAVTVRLFFPQAAQMLHSPEVDHRPSRTAEVRRSVPRTRRPGASQQCWSGSSSKANFSVCHSQQFYHTFHAALETQSRAHKLMGLGALTVTVSDKPTCLTPFQSAACCHSA